MNRLNPFLYLIALTISALPATLVRAEQCECRTLSLQASLPRSAKTTGEHHPTEGMLADAYVPLVAPVNLDEAGFQGGKLFLRFSRIGPFAWQVEGFVTDPSEMSSSTPDFVFPPISFESNGKVRNTVIGEVRPPESAAATFGGHLYLNFAGLSEDGAALRPRIDSINTVQCPCFEYAKEVIGPEELKQEKFQQKRYSPKDGLAAMLKDTVKLDE